MRIGVRTREMARVKGGDWRCNRKMCGLMQKARGMATCRRDLWVDERCVATKQKEQGRLTSTTDSARISAANRDLNVSCSEIRQAPNLVKRALHEIQQAQ